MIVIFFFFLLFVYSALLFYLAYCYHKAVVVSPANQKFLPITVIICARNEVYNIAMCLKSVLLQNYPQHLLQLIIVNDHSTDKTLQEIEKILVGSPINYTIINNEKRFGKKRSLQVAIAQAAHEHVVLRDADTYTLSSRWLQIISSAFNENQADLLIGPVYFARKSGWIYSLQRAESFLLDMVTGGSAQMNRPFLCSGANLAFTRSIYQQVGEFNEHIHIESGDDIFFLESVKKVAGSRILYLNSQHGAVETWPERNLNRLLRQRTRWASKFKSNSNILNRALAMTVFICNLAFLFSIVMLVTSNHYRSFWLLFIFIKYLVDILLLLLGSSFKRDLPLSHLMSLPFIYPVYSLAVGVFALTAKPTWKK